MAQNEGGKNRARARQAVKNNRRKLRRGGSKSKPHQMKAGGRTPAWMRDKPMMTFGNGGTDKSGSKKRSIAFYAVCEDGEWRRVGR